MPDRETEAPDGPTRDDIDAMSGPVVLEIGAGWCGHCQALRPHLDEALAQHPEVRHVRVEDGRGKPLGRSFQVKLWPTLVFLRDGQVVRKLVRPAPGELGRAMAAIVT